ncbi:MAG: four helix bundle protein [Phycisphaerales bacterium]|nr:four helix bundle protein [Phycisphaerales bacterium]
MSRVALKSYRDLEVWQIAMELVVLVYEVTKMFPDTERFGLTSQMRRGAVSIPSNIAEGYGRTHRPEYLRHLSIANGSLLELETQFDIAVRLSMLDEPDAKIGFELCERLGRMLRRLMVSLKENARTA